MVHKISKTVVTRYTKDCKDIEHLSFKRSRPPEEAEQDMIFVFINSRSSFNNAYNDILFKREENDPLLKLIVTGDKKGIIRNDIESRHSSKESYVIAEHITK